MSQVVSAEVKPELPGGQPPVVAPLRKRVLSSLVYSLAGSATLLVVRFAFNLIVTQLLAPQIFGLMTLVNVFMEGLVMFSDVGLGLSIVRSEHGDEPHYLNCAWSVQVVRGFGLCLGACALAWPMAGFYRAPELIYLLPVAGLSAIFTGFNSVAIFTCERRLSLRRLVGLQVGCYVLNTAVVVALLWRTDLGVWALIVGRLIGSFLEMLGSHWLLDGPRCRFTWDRAVVAEILHFGKWVFISSACTFLANQADRLIIPRLTDLGILGVFNLAVQLALAGKEIVERITMRVVFPLYSRVHQQGGSLAASFRSVHPWAAGFGAFITAGLIGCGPAFFRCLFTPPYHDAGWMLQLVAVGGWITMLTTVSGCMLWVLGNARAHMAGMVVKLLATPWCAWGGYALGDFKGLILGFAAAELLRYCVTLWALRSEGLPILRRDLCLTAALAVTCAIALQVGSLLGQQPSWAQFTAQVLTVMLLWLGLAGVRHSMRVVTTEK